jgi:hypothetical protein
MVSEEAVAAAHIEEAFLVGDIEEAEGVGEDEGSVIVVSFGSDTGGVPFSVTFPRGCQFSTRVYVGCK